MIKKNNNDTATQSNGGTKHHRYTLTNGILKRALGLINKRTKHGDIIYDLTCSRCLKKIKIGDKVFAQMGSLNKTKRYHEKCYHSMFLS